MKKRGRKEKGVHIYLSDRLAYTLVAILILAAVGIGVYALTPGVAPNPGHLISDVAPPAGCSAGQDLQWNGANWVCATPTPQTNLSGIVMGGYIIQYVWQGYTYSTLSGINAINVDGNGLKLLAATCASATIWGVATSSCTCPSGYTMKILTAGTGTLQFIGLTTKCSDNNLNTYNPPCTVTDYTWGCIKN